MKKCKFCGQCASDAVNNCPSCGANQFISVCNNCGNEFEGGLFCPKCGIKVFQKEKVCPQCGNHYYTNACPNCGYNGLNKNNVQKIYVERTVMQTQPVQRTVPQYVYPTQPQAKVKDKTTALLLCIFGGFLGAHKFYEEKYVAGLVYLFTCGIFCIGWFLDIFAILAKPSKYIP